MMPHKHPEDRIYTVISGVFYIGLGEEFDERKLTAHGPGSVLVLPGGQPHFHWAKSGEYITQVSAIGPLGLAYIDPTKPGPYVIRVRLPAGVKMMPHKHPEDRIYTVMSGVFYIGLGESFDGDKVKAYPPGSVVVLPGDTWHFHWAKAGEYVTQVTAIGPLGLEYHDAHDDPRQQHGGVTLDPVSQRTIPGTAA